MNNLEIYKLKKDYKISERELRRVLKRAGKLLKLKNLKISLAFVDNKTIRKLNKKYRFRNKVTDVLSFEIGDPHFFSPYFVESEKGQTPPLPPCFAFGEIGGVRGGGEIIISYPEAKRQAREYGESLQKVISRLFIHGLLHLAGMEHKTKSGRKKMTAMERKIMKQ